MTQFFNYDETFKRLSRFITDLFILYFTDDGIQDLVVITILELSALMICNQCTQ